MSSTRPPLRIAKGSILDLSSPPSSPIPSPYSSPAPVPILSSNFRNIQPAPWKPATKTKPGHSSRQQSRSPALKAMSSSRMNHRQVKPESSATGAVGSLKWVDNYAGVLDLTMDNYEVQSLSTVLEYLQLLIHYPSSSTLPLPLSPNSKTLTPVPQTRSADLPNRIPARPLNAPPLHVPLSAHRPRRSRRSQKSGSILVPNLPLLKTKTIAIATKTSGVAATARKNPLSPPSTSRSPPTTTTTTPPNPQRASPSTHSSIAFRSLTVLPSADVVSCARRTSTMRILSPTRNRAD